jgi:hypothetical protein
MSREERLLGAAGRDTGRRGLLGAGWGEAPQATQLNAGISEAL